MTDPRVPRTLALLLAAAPLAARAGDAAIHDEVTLGRTASPGVDETGTFFSNHLGGWYAPSDAWTFQLGWTASRSDDEAVFHSFAGDVTWQITDAWSVNAGLAASPAQASDEEVPLCRTYRQGAICFDAEEEYRSLTPSLALAFDGDGWGLDASLVTTFYEVEYTATEAYRLDGRGRKVPLRGRLAAVGRQAVGRSETLEVTEHGLGAGGYLELGGGFSVDLHGAWYFYVSNEDSTVLRQRLARAVGGLPVAPVAWQVSPGLYWVFSDAWAVDVRGSYAPYEDECNGRTTTGSASLRGYVGDVLLWGGPYLQVDTPPQDEDTATGCGYAEPAASATSLYFTLGAEYAF